MTGSGCPGVGIEVFVDCCEDVVFPVGKVVELHVEWEGCDSVVQLNHVLLELPESVCEDDGIVPTVLTSRISCTSGFNCNESPWTGMHGGVLHGARVGDQRDGEVGMVVGSHDLWRILLFFSLDGVSFGHIAQQVPSLRNLLFGLVLGQWADKVIGLAGVIAWLRGIEHTAALRHIEVSK